MSQDKEAMIILVLGILFCLLIVIASYSTDRFTILIIDQWNEQNAAVQNTLTVAGGLRKDKLLNG
jgi:CHASE3 domain sensor protein